MQMGVDREVGSNLLAQGTAIQERSFADMVADRDTSVFTPTPAEAAALPSGYAMATGQSGVHFVTLTVPVPSRPIRLVRSGRPLSPAPSSWVLLGNLPETAVRAWSDLGAQYVAEQSSSSATAMITSALAEVSQADLDVVENALLDVEDLLKDVEGLKGEDTPSGEDILHMELNELDLDDDVSPGRFSRLEPEHKAEPRPVLETANQVKEDFRQEASVPKVSSSSEQVTTQAEDLGAEFRQNVAMRQTLPEAAVPQPTPVQPRAVPISAHQALRWKSLCRFL